MDAGGIGGQVVTGEGVGARARAAAHLSIPAASAPPLELIGPSQVREQRCVAIDVRHRLLPDVARCKGQKPRWTDVAGVGDEAETLAVVDALGRAVQAVLVTIAPPRHP